MEEIDKMYDKESTLERGTPMGKRQSISEGLEKRRSELRLQLADVESAINAIQMYPEIEKFLSLLDKVWRYY